MSHHADIHDDRTMHHHHHDAEPHVSDMVAQTRWTSHHEHVFGQNQPTAGERRTLIVVVITAITMVVEIAAGMMYGSMALLADGLHMGSHAVALGIAAFAYRYARRHAADPRFSFGTGKVNPLAGYSGAVLLGVFALGMAAESIERFVSPVEIAINQAPFVAVIGLLVNGASVLILVIKGAHGHHYHSEEHPHESDHARTHHHHKGRAEARDACRRPACLEHWARETRGDCRH